MKFDRINQRLLRIHRNRKKATVQVVTKEEIFKSAVVPESAGKLLHDHWNKSKNPQIWQKQVKVATMREGPFKWSIRSLNAFENQLNPWNFWNDMIIVCFAITSRWAGSFVVENAADHTTKLSPRLIAAGARYITSAHIDARLALLLLAFVRISTQADTRFLSDCTYFASSRVSASQRNSVWREISTRSAMDFSNSW